MSGDSKRYFECFFKELETQGIPYVILHSYQNLPEAVASDVDYAVRDSDLQKIPAIQTKIARELGWVLAQILQHQVCAFYSVLVDLDNPANSLKLDVCSHYVKDHCFLLRDSALLEDRRPFRGFYIPAPRMEFIYVLAKVFGKNKKLDGYLSGLRTLWEQDRIGAQQCFDELFGDTGASLEEWFSRPPDAWAPLNGIMRQRNRYGLPLLCRELSRVVKRALQPTGLHIALLGSDGTGKSTLLAQLHQTLEPCFRKQRVFHFRPGVFQKNAGAPVSNPHAKPARSILLGWIKVFYYFFDQWAGWFLWIFPGKLRSTLLLFDRSFDDMLVDEKRYRLKGTTTLVRMLRMLLPREDMVLVLDAPPEVIHRRKNELPVPELERQRALLRNLAQGDARYILISVEEAPDEVARAVARKIAELLASRTQHRLGLPG